MAASIEARKEKEANTVPEALGALARDPQQVRWFSQEWKGLMDVRKLCTPPQVVRGTIRHTLASILEAPLPHVSFVYCERYALYERKAATANLALCGEQQFKTLAKSW